jgi:hypothetical protein
MSERLPTADTVNLMPPDADEVMVVARACASAAAPSSTLTPLQRVLLEAMFPAMTGHAVSLGAYEPMTATEFATAMARRDLGRPAGADRTPSEG